MNNSNPRLGILLSFIVPVCIALLSRFIDLPSGVYFTFSTIAVLTITLLFNKGSSLQKFYWLITSYMKSVFVLTLINRNLVFDSLELSLIAITCIIFTIGLFRPLPKDYHALSDIEKFYLYFGRFTANPKVLNFALFDIFLLLQFFKIAQKGQSTYRLKPKPDQALNLVVVYFGVPLETLVQHFLVSMVSEKIAWLLTAFAIYFIIWYTAYAITLKRRGSYFHAGRFYGSVGAHWNFSTDVSNIKSVEHYDASIHNNYFDLTLKSEPNIVVEFYQDVNVLGLFGLTTATRSAKMSFDKPDDFKEAFDVLRRSDAVRSQIDEELPGGGQAAVLQVSGEQVVI